MLVLLVLVVAVWMVVVSGILALDGSDISRASSRMAIRSSSSRSPVPSLGLGRSGILPIG